MPPETLPAADRVPPAPKSYGSFWDAPEPTAADAPADRADAYAAFADAADL